MCSRACSATVCACVGYAREPVQAHGPEVKEQEIDGTIGPQKPMHLRTTHAPKEGKYDYLTKDGEVSYQAR